MSRFDFFFYILFLDLRSSSSIKKFNIYHKNAVILNISTFELGTKSIQKELKNRLKIMLKSMHKVLTNQVKIRYALDYLKTLFFMVSGVPWGPNMELKYPSKSISKSGLSFGTLQAPIWDHFETILGAFWGQFGDHVRTIRGPC